MLTLIVADTKSFRKSHLNALVEEFSPNEIITFDDTLLAVSDLEQYIFPSLFNNGTSFIHAQFILDTKEKDLTAILLKKLIASPTMFVFEELVVSKPFLTNAKKQGAVVHVEEKIKSTKQENLFSVTSLITLPKKDRWIAYEKAIAKYPIEAILGMLYWKVRDLALKEKNNGPYHTLYTAMIEAHATAWIQGTPLELAIEKVLLTQ
jgi:hypothetical protein